MSEIDAKIGKKLQELRESVVCGYSKKRYKKRNTPQQLEECFSWVVRYHVFAIRTDCPESLCTYDYIIYQAQKAIIK